MSKLRMLTSRAPVLALAATMLASALAPSTPAVAQEPIVRDHRDPYARVQLVIKRIIVHDDMDWGNGEIAISFKVNSLRPGCTAAGAACETTLLSGALPEFSATDGTTKTFDRVIPSYTDSVTDDAISPPFGIPLRPGNQYELSVAGHERDATLDDRLGFLNTSIANKEGEIQIGTRTERGFLNFCRVFGGCGTDHAKFSVEYEIRNAPLPDLRPVNIKIYDLPGSPKKLVCAAIQNVHTADAGAFEVSLKIDGVMPPGGKATAGRLASGDAGELCAEIALPATGQHQLSAVVDEADGVLEYNERNNVYEQEYVAPKQVGSAGTVSEATTNKPVVSATAAQADLTVSAIKVNGQAPDGKDDCKDGKNTVAVTIKNAGAEKAGAFTVRLDADGTELDVESVDGLEAGKEREVRFEDVKLKKGEHTLTASADSKTTVAESNEANNELKVTARCQGDR